MKLKENIGQVIVEATKCEYNLQRGVVRWRTLGKLGESGKAPPIMVTMETAKDAAFVVKSASHLSKIHGFRNVYICPDMSKEDREKRKVLSECLKKKIKDFPEHKWVIRQGVVTSIGRYNPPKLSESDDGKEMDRSFDY